MVGRSSVHIGDIDGALKTIEPIVVSFPKTPWVQNTYCALLLNKPERLNEALQVCILAKTAADGMTPTTGVTLIRVMIPKST